MTVYLVVSETDYEHPTTHGVYSSFELANENAKIVQGWIDDEKFFDDRVVIYERELDETATLPDF